MSSAVLVVLYSWSQYSTLLQKIISNIPGRKNRNVLRNLLRKIENQLAIKDYSYIYIYIYIYMNNRVELIA